MNLKELDRGDITCSQFIQFAVGIQSDRQLNVAVLF